MLGVPKRSDPSGPVTPPPECKALGKRIRALRDERGWSQEQLAERAGIHRVYLGGIETGIRNPSLRHIASLARALDVRIADLFP
jgi:transcriptional regulator with XRE-family HTH domain